jgi:hypothetical protein
MTLAASCPRCTAPTTESAGTWHCLDHGAIAPLWRPGAAEYDAFVEHLQQAGNMPTLMPWPLAPGWRITDFGCVAVPGGPARACLVSCAESEDVDGPAELTIVEEEPGVGLGARCAGVVRTDPGVDIGEGPPWVRVRVDNRPVPVWPVATGDLDGVLDRAVFAGEAHGRWLWLVLRPASAALLLREDWVLVDASGLGPELIDLPFGGNPPPW